MRRLLHGVRIEVAPGLSEDLCRALLAALAPGDAGAPPDLVVSVEESRRPVPQDGGGRPIFVHGVLRGWARGGAIRLADGASAVEIAPDGRRISGAIHVEPGAGRPSDRGLLALALAVALRSHGLYHLHAAALASREGATVLVPGTGGSGKTTLALALASAGYTPACDDVCFLARDGGAAVVVPVPRAFHVGEQTARAFPGVAAHLGAAVASGKRELDPRRALGIQPPARLAPPAALLFPSIAGAPRTATAPRAPEEAFEGLLASSALVVVDGMPGAREHLALLGELVRGAVALDVTLGDDVLAEPGRVARAVDAAAADARTGR
jgi:hypothetical protein